METWPATLQELINEEGFNYTFGETAIISQMDTGPTKKRRRFTKGIDDMSCTINLPKSLYATFYTFYDVSINGGVDTFYFDHPITGSTDVWRFKETPKISTLGGLEFRVSMVWERIP